jgi:drug/metabolite transporter (DMT)-like permease
MTLHTPAVNRPMSLAEWAMLLTLSVLWGGSFFFNEVAVAALPVFTVVVGRVALAALVLLVVCRVAGVRLPTDRGVWLAFLGMGVLNNVIPFSLIVLGQTQIASGVASILNATTPMFTVLVAHLLTADEKLTPARAFGVLAGFAGVAVMIGIDALDALGQSVLAQLACLAGALSYACAGVFGRRFRRMGVAPLATATGQVVASSLCLIPLMALVDRPWTLPMPGWTPLAALAGVATLSTALAYVLYFRILATAGATNLLLVTLLIPVTAVLLGVSVLSETLAPRHLVGVGIIAVGLAAIDGRVLRAWRRG